MGALLATFWLPLPFALALALAGAGFFVAWMFLDCEFFETARIAAQDLRLRFVHDPYLRHMHRREQHGPRLTVFALMAALSAIAGLAGFLGLAFGDAADRSRANILSAIAIAAIWFGLFTQHRRLWWMAFRWRIARLQPAMKTAATLLQKQWPGSSVVLPGLGNYGVSCQRPDTLLSADCLRFAWFRGAVGSIARKQDQCVSFAIEGYRGWSVERRKPGWSPPPVAVIEVRSPPHTRTVRHEYEFPLGDEWYVAYYDRTLDFKDEVDPDVLAAITQRPPGLRLPHRGGRFRALADLDLKVATLHKFPFSDTPSWMGVDHRVLPKDEIVRLDYEPDPSRSTACHVLPENFAGLKDRLTDPRWKKHRDYAGYQVLVSYEQLDKDFQWLKAEGG
jgi:hypothetical protein